MIRCANEQHLRIRAALFAVMFTSTSLGAQAVQKAPAGAPVNTTGQCRDRSYTYAASRFGACLTHGGLTAWWGLTRAVRDESLPSPNSTGIAASGAERPAERGKLRGAGSDTVWINTRSRVYHCPGTRWFGQTTRGRYATERQALESGAHPAYGRRCGESRERTSQVQWKLALLT